MMYLNGDSVMGRQNSNAQIEQFIDDFNRSVHHPILDREIGQPKLNKHSLLFLLLPKLNGEEWTSQAHTAAIAVSAVYKAFDAHDDVDVHDVTTTDQQLKVLSGDYLSGVYYQLIASISNFKFIHVLSNTIGRINEIKTEFHANPEMKKDEYIKAIQGIQTDCTIQFFQSFGYEKYVPITKVALPLLSLLNIEDEAEDSAGRWMLKNEHSETALKQLSSELEREIKEADFLAPHLVEEIRKMTMPLLGEMT